jgi:hypothetical protein
MKKGYLLSVWIFVVVVMLISSACSPSRIAVDEYDQVPAGESTSQEQEAPPEDEPAEVEDQQPEEPVEPAEPVSEFPEDVPIIDGAYDVQPSRKGLVVQYQVDAEIDDVAGYYQDELPSYGWDVEGPPDNVVGSIATMSRENTAGDTLAINMQYNSLGGFVRVQITIARVD